MIVLKHYVNNHFLIVLILRQESGKVFASYYVVFKIISGISGIIVAEI